MLAEVTSAFMVDEIENGLTSANSASHHATVEMVIAHRPKSWVRVLFFWKKKKKN